MSNLLEPLKTTVTCRMFVRPAPNCGFVAGLSHTDRPDEVLARAATVERAMELAAAAVQRRIDNRQAVLGLIVAVMGILVLFVIR